MRGPFSSSARTRFVDHDDVLEIARGTARRIAAAHPEVLRILLFGSFARGDYGARSDLDLLIVLKESDKPASERLGDFLQYVPAYPTDMFPVTEAEIAARLQEGDPFLARALNEGILLYPE